MLLERVDKQDRFKVPTRDGQYAPLGPGIFVCQFVWDWNTITWQVCLNSCMSLKPNAYMVVYILCVYCKVVKGQVRMGEWFDLGKFATSGGKLICEIKSLWILDILP